MAAKMENLVVEENDLRRHIVEIGKRLYGQGLIVAGEGNISSRVDADRILITPAGLGKGRMAETDLLLVNRGGDALQDNRRQPSSELGMHLCVYDKRPDAAACVHAHPPYATACSVAGISLSDPVLPEIVATMGQVVTAEYATPSTPEVANSIAAAIAGHDSIILKNHGVLTIGPDLETAFMRMEMTEHLAQVIFLARALGRVDVLTPEQVRAIRHAAGGKD